MRRAKHRRRAGFTLAEILVVVVILGIAGAIIVPQISSRDDLKAAAAARMIMADLIYAQNLAITQQQNRYVLFDLDNRRYSVVAPDMTVLTHPVTKSAYTVTYGAGGQSGLREMSLVSAVFTAQNGSTSAKIGFDELGTPLVYLDGPTSVMTSGTIVVQTGRFRLNITIEAYTGLISVSPAN